MKIPLFILFIYSAVPGGMWDLSSPTRDQTCIHCVGRQRFNHWTAMEVPRFFFLNLLPCSFLSFHSQSSGRTHLDSLDLSSLPGLCIDLRDIVGSAPDPCKIKSVTQEIKSHNFLVSWSIEKLYLLYTVAYSGVMSKKWTYLN